MKASALFWCAIAFPSTACAARFNNPLRSLNGGDPFIATYQQTYYLVTTTFDNIQITRANTLGALNGSEKKVAYTETADRSGQVWASELHLLEGSWYLYFSSLPGPNKQHVIYALKGGASPWDNYETTPIQISPENSIDGTVVRYGDLGNYFVWSCFPSDLQSLCAAKMITPTSIGPSSIISQPTESWETVGRPVNEGPAGLYHGGKTFVAFSASYCGTANYSLGYLTWNGGDPLLTSSYTKMGPVFAQANGNYGTGHNGFFTSFDGTQIWNVYHATAIPAGSCGPDRYSMAQILNWNADGTPNFGRPAPLKETLDGPSGEP